MFLEEKGDTSKQLAKIVKCHLALKYFMEENDFVSLKTIDVVSYILS